MSCSAVLESGSLFIPTSILGTPISMACMDCSRLKTLSWRSWPIVIFAETCLKKSPVSSHWGSVGFDAIYVRCRCLNMNVIFEISASTVRLRQQKVVMGARKNEDESKRGKWQHRDYIKILRAVSSA